MPPLPSGVNVFSFRAQFPELVDVKDADIQMTLQIATLWIDKAVWSASDYPLALLYWSAHYITLKQLLLASAQLGGSGATDLYIRSIAFGDRHVAFGERRKLTQTEKMSGPGEDMLSYTEYGMLFLQLRARNIVAAVTV